MTAPTLTTIFVAAWAVAVALIVGLVVVPLALSLLGAP